MKCVIHGLVASSALGLAACSSEAPLTDDFGYEGTGIAVSVAALDLQGVADACYSFEIRNEVNQVVVARGSAQNVAGGGVAGQGGDGGPTGLSGRESDPLCSSRFGNSGGAINYVAPCDASEPEHTVTLWVNAVCQAGSLDGDVACVPMYGYQNPCGNAGCEVTTLCIEDSDMPVRFEFTVMAAAKQGFFDIAVRFDEVFCSAKLDTCYADGSPISLLFDDSGNEVPTAVAAVACTAGTEDIDTHLFATTFTVNCGGTTYGLPLAGEDLEGKTELVELDGSGNPVVGGDTINAGLYFGTEALVNGNTGPANKVFTNIAFALPTDPSGCEVNWFVVPSDSAQCPASLDGSQGSYSQVAGVTFQGVVSTATCEQNSLDATDSDVFTSYLDDNLAPAYTSLLVEDAQAFTPPCPQVGVPVLENGAPLGCVDFTPNGKTHSVTVSYACDDTCDLYFDGAMVRQRQTGEGWSFIRTYTIQNVPTGCHVLGVHTVDTARVVSGFIAKVSVDGAPAGAPGFFVTASTPAMTVAEDAPVDAQGDTWSELDYDTVFPQAVQCGTGPMNTWSSGWSAAFYTVLARPIWYNTTCNGNYNDGFARILFTIL